MGIVAAGVVLEYVGRLAVTKSAPGNYSDPRNNSDLMYLGRQRGQLQRHAQWTTA